jgi:hypothetical protein
LPVVTTLRLGHQFRFINNSSGLVTVNSSGGNLVTTVAAGATVFVSCILITGTTAASWSVFNAAATYSTLASMSAANAAALVGGGVTALHYHVLQNYLTGLKLSNNGTDPTNDIDIAAGQAMDSTNAIMITGAAIIKRLDAGWAVGTNAGGLDTGAIANATYHVWLIKRSDTGVVDALFSTSASAPTMPANYDYKRRIGSIVRAAAAIKLFVQDGDDFQWLVPVADVGANNPGTGAVTRTLTLPTGIRVKAKISVLAYAVLAGSATNGVFISDLSITDSAPSGYIQSVYVGSAAAESIGLLTECYTNTSAQVRSRLEASNANTWLYIGTQGWTDRRGQDG